MRRIVAIAARECFGKDFQTEQDVAVRNLLRGIVLSGGCASRTAFEELIRTAFESGLTAAMLAWRDKQFAPFLQVIKECHATVDRAEHAHAHELCNACGVRRDAHHLGNPAHDFVPMFRECGANDFQKRNSE